MLAREKAMRLVLASAAIPGAGADLAVARMMNVLEDMDLAMSFMTHWTHGPVLELQPDERLDRWGITVRLSARAERDVDFRRALLGNPRYLHALAIHENLGIKPLDYLWQIDAVDVVEETPELHWLLLPDCHLGCATPEVLASSPSNGTCRACGKPIGPTSACQRANSISATVADRIHEVDEFIMRSVKSNAAARERLMADPTSFFCRRMCWAARRTARR